MAANRNDPNLPVHDNGSRSPLNSSSNSSSEEVSPSSTPSGHESNPFTASSNVLSGPRHPSAVGSISRPDSLTSSMLLNSNPFSGGTASSRGILHRSASAGLSGFASSSMQHLPMGSKGSMVLYRLAGEDDRVSRSNRSSGNSDTNALLPPKAKFTAGDNGSGTSSTRSSISFGFGEDVDHKYPVFHNSSTQHLNHVPSSLSHNSTGSTTSPFGGLSLTTAALIAQAESQGPFSSFPAPQTLLPSSPSPAHSPYLAPRAALASAPSTPLSSSAPLPLNAPRGLVPYAYDPAVDSLLPDDEEDILHDPNATPEAEKKLYTRGGLLYHNGKGGHGGGHWSWRGCYNLGLLILLMLSLVALFLGYPVITEFTGRARKNLIDGNIRVNATGQAPVLFGVRELVDKDTPDSAKVRTGFDGQTYDLVFSDEFNTPGRTFWPGDDPYWEAMDIWYGVTQDLEWYDPQQVTTRDGALVITMDSVTTLQSGLTPGSTAPFTTAQNHNLSYRSGMVQSWNKLCFTSGYVEIAAKLPAPGPSAQGYWPGAWTMGNLGRPGYRATTDGMWPYSYDSCDVGTFPNQTDHSGNPPAAAFSDKSWPEYDKKLSVLTGQRLSACTCPNQDHPGPYGKLDAGSNAERYRGRGAPEIDIIEIQHDGVVLPGTVASQSAQFAPFTHDYDNYVIYDPSITYPNSYVGSPLQQAVSGLTKVPDDGFEIPGGRYVTYGFEYWANPNNRDEGFITWQVDGKASTQMRPGTMGPDKGVGGSLVDQRIIPEEPMAIIMNLGISHGWTQIELETLQFPAELKFDYVRVYQRRGQTNVGCNPKDYPTTEYIQNHLDQYMNKNATLWEYEKPTNRLYDGCT
ncbi:glycoside hydrolase family 16 protein [Moniliophthora roreri]|uniref:GH16 domain-containing protein n=1 Tax=Moniliophthora roreri TaxID=221103 RepID=A0A0W0F770_MONRR|nr:glycoside hydrolase family 16 protein [Moniliophthora roreri]